MKKFSPDGRFLGGIPQWQARNEIRIFDVNTNQILKRDLAANQAVVSFTVLPDASVFCSDQNGNLYHLK